MLQNEVYGLSFNLLVILTFKHDLISLFTGTHFCYKVIAVSFCFPGNSQDFDIGQWLPIFNVNQQRLLQINTL